MTATIQHLVGGTWFDGNGDTLRSVNPSRPSIVVAEGTSATVSDIDAAIKAASSALSSWAAAPLHQRGAVLMAAADVVDRNAEAWGLELATEEGKTKAEGIGMGLSICRSIVEAHGGRIWASSVDSQQGRQTGSVFHFSLPTAKGAG